MISLAITAHMNPTVPPDMIQLTLFFRKIYTTAPDSEGTGVDFFANQGNDEFIPKILPYQSWNFPGGEVGCRFTAIDDLSADNMPSHATIFAQIRSSDGIMELLLATDAFRRLYPAVPLTLMCPYLPYARQDRVCEPGDSLSLKVMGDLINLQQYNQVLVLDPHSEEGYKYIKNLRTIPFTHALLYALHNSKYADKLRSGSIYGGLKIISPDQGAIGRAEEAAAVLKTKVAGIGIKHRDSATGDITSISMRPILRSIIPVGDDTNIFEDQDLLLVDDICDGGRTFIELEKVLRPYKPRTISLYTSHGIYSEGMEQLQKAFDHVMTPYYF
jgi:ribose-phosphate pyrophosphokinase